MKQYIENWELKYRSSAGILLLQFSIFCYAFGFHGPANVSLLLIVILRLFSRNRLTFLSEVVKNRFVWIFWSYWIITLLGLIYSQDMYNGAKMLDTRSLMLITPLAVLSLPATRENYKRLLWSVLLSVCLASLVSLVGATFNYFNTGDSGYFYNDNLSGIVSKQGTYMALMVNVALVINIFLFFDMSRRRFWLIASGLFLIVIQLLLAVRTALGVMFLVMAAMVLYMIFSQGRKTAVLAIATCTVLFIASIFMFPQMINRFRSLASSTEYRFDNPNGINHFNGEVNSENWNGLTVRLALWECGWNVISDNPIMGVGTGDYDAKMREQYEQNNFNYAIEMNFGVHNQYLYSWIAFGLPGLFLLIFMMLYPSVCSWKIKNYLYVACMVVFGLSMVTENIFSRYYGVYLFSLVNSLIFFFPRRIS